MSKVQHSFDTVDRLPHDELRKNRAETVRVQQETNGRFREFAIQLRSSVLPFRIAAIAAKVSNPAFV